MNRRWFYFGLPVLGTVFCLIYIQMATVDVVYSDYIRLINSYLPDVWAPDKFFVPDVLTRIPINYLGRLINVEVFGLSLLADRVSGVLGLGPVSYTHLRFLSGPTMRLPLRSRRA